MPDPIMHGVALIRLSNNAEGCGRLEEFYAVMFDGEMLAKRFASYAESFKHCDKLRKKADTDV